MVKNHAIMASSKRIIVFFVIGVYLVAMICRLFLNTNEDDGIAIKTELSRKDPRIYIGIYTYPMYQHRVDILNTTWIPEFLEKMPQSQIEFVSSGLLERSSIPVRIVPDAPIEYVFARLIFRFISCLEHFVNDLDVEWCLVTTDDVFIHVDRLSQMVKTMTKEYNTEIDIVFRGEAFHPEGPFDPYIHGGSGYFLSRASARRILENKTEFLSKAEEYVPDDVHIVHALKYLNLSFSEVNDKRLLGSNIGLETKDRLEYSNFKDLPKCDYKTKKFGQNKYAWPTPFSDIVVWHGAHFDGYIMKEGRRALNIIPDYVNWFTYDRAVYMCDNR